MQQRRKSVFASAPFAMKQAALGAGVTERKNGAPLSLAAVVFALFVFATFLYNEDIKSITDFQFGAAATRAKAPDLYLLQEAQAAAHVAVDTLARRGEEVIVRVMDATANTTTAAAALTTITPNQMSADANAADVGQEKDRDVTIPTVAAGAGEAKQREDEEAQAAAALRTVVSVPETCDLYRGNWVYDEVNAPVYKEAECEFVTEQVTCTRNGRRDDTYQKWRWQPTDCDLPRYALLSFRFFFSVIASPCTHTGHITHGLYHPRSRLPKARQQINVRYYSNSEIPCYTYDRKELGNAGSTRGCCWSGSATSV
jgi:hypothetical protein